MYRSVKKNFIFNLVNSASQLLFPLITFPYASCIIMADSIGQINYFNSIISYISLFTCLGIPMNAIREVAKARNDMLAMQRVVVEILSLHGLLTVGGYLLDSSPGQCRHSFIFDIKRGHFLLYHGL